MKKSTYIRFTAVPLFLTTIAIAENFSECIVNLWQFAALLVVVVALSISVIGILQLAAEVDELEDENKKLRAKK